MEPIVEWSVERGGKSGERGGGREKKGTKIHREQDRQIGVGMTTKNIGREEREGEREIHAGNGRQSPHARKY